jgi:RNA polymerase sigma factor (sigma-70 family)
LEDRVHLFRFVRTLPADQRRVIRMRFGEQKTVPEIARELQRSEGSVKQLQFRAIQTLRGKMRDQNG